MAGLEEIFRYLDAHLDDAVADALRYCRQPSVSAQNLGLEECAALTAQLLREAGCASEVVPVPGGPSVVYGRLAGTSDKTLLLYNHYDVQPPEPLLEWTSPPFEPLVREGKLYARGIADTKGNVVARLWALRAYRETMGELPVAVKLLIEGEEEVGSPHFEDFLRQPRERERFAADYCLWEGSQVDWAGRPDIRLGVKGILYVELEAHTAARDLHSSWAAVAPSPAWRLLWALGSLKGPDERVRIPGFYDAVRPDTREELASLEGMEDDLEQTRQAFGVGDFLGGVRGASYWHRLLMEPTCNICGLEAGYTQAGVKTVLPAVARAKLDFRLVPDQRPQEVLALLRRHLDQEGFSDIAVRALAAEAPARSPISAPFVGLVARAAQQVYGAPPGIRPSIAGTGPMAPVVELLGVTVADCGIAYPGSGVHAPNEHVRIADFLNGMKHCAAILYLLREEGAGTGR
ncbi:MAG: M20/M25/M40 family metallo-hydrolase [Chloroflexi bacterium]|nr:M20/M25/M40 family metallo-hydrolase [Chloroflexota bacterium]